MRTLKDLIEVSLINMEQRIEQRIDGIEQSLFPQGGAGKEPEEEEDEAGEEVEDDKEVGAAVMERINAMKQALQVCPIFNVLPRIREAPALRLGVVSQRYQGYLGAGDPKIVSLLEQLADTCAAEPQLADEAQLWRKRENKARKQAAEREAEEQGSFCD